MLSKTLYTLCNLLSTPYNNLHLVSKNVSFINHLLLEKIYLNKLLIFNHRKISGSILKNIHFSYKYKILEKNLQLLKLKLNLKVSFKVHGAPNNILSYRISEYIIILEHLQDNFKIQFLIENEDNPIAYNYLLNTNLSQIDNVNFYINKVLNFKDPSLIDSLPESSCTSKLFSYTNFMKRNDSSFDVSKACSYAETFALTPNPDYRSFDGIGGDCTNFASQILYAGGISKTKTWNPYTNTWIRVADLYIYLTTQNLAIELPSDDLLTRGCLIQFYAPIVGRFFHNGFITYKLPNNDCLYCCHSYNKLNYPLSEIYPNRYPKLRGLKFVDIHTQDLDL